MAFKLRKLNHSPQWYREHCFAENGGSPAFRAQLTNDMKYLGADIDSTQKYQERVGSYEETWDAILTKESDATLTGDIRSVMERENEDGFKPKAQYSQEPFLSITRIMIENDLTTTDVKEFLKWSANDENLKKARETKAKKEDERVTEHRKKIGNLFKKNTPWGR